MIEKTIKKPQLFCGVKKSKGFFNVLTRLMWILVCALLLTGITALIVIAYLLFIAA